MAQQINLLQLLLHNELSIGTNVSVCNVFVLLIKELFFRRLLVAIVIASEPTRHAEIVHKERVLVNVLKDAELSFIQ